MPLKPGKENISFNISELMASWEETGAINGDKIRTKKEALSRAIAISLNLARTKKPKKI